MAPTRSASTRPPTSPPRGRSPPATPSTPAPLTSSWVLSPLRHAASTWLTRLLLWAIKTTAAVLALILVAHLAAYTATAWRAAVPPPTPATVPVSTVTPSTAVSSPHLAVVAMASAHADMAKTLAGLRYPSLADPQGPRPRPGP